MKKAILITSLIYLLGCEDVQPEQEISQKSYPTNAIFVNYYIDRGGFRERINGYAILLTGDYKKDRKIIRQTMNQYITD